jgi:glucokinase
LVKNWIYGVTVAEIISPKSWQLVADIGGTHARFAKKQDRSNKLFEIASVRVSGHEHFYRALAEYLRESNGGEWDALPAAACFAVATRIDDEEIRFTNSSWVFNRLEVSEMLGGIHLELINDFAAKGYGISELTHEDWQQLGGTDPLPGKPVGIIGPGTGLGISIVVPTDQSYVVLDGEGGHVDFAPITKEEYQVLEILAARFGRVSVERLLCGNGLVNIYQALGSIQQIEPMHTTPEAVSKAGMDGSDVLARHALHLFCRVLGSVAGNLALTAGALGGVYITGGIVPAILDFFHSSEFRARFEHKGRFRDYLARIPVRVVTRQDLGLLGAANRLTLAGH